jgi:hypothetical protein
MEIPPIQQAKIISYIQEQLDIGLAIGTWLQ